MSLIRWMQGQNRSAGSSPQGSPTAVLQEEGIMALLTSIATFLHFLHHKMLPRCNPQASALLQMIGVIESLFIY